MSEPVTIVLSTPIDAHGKQYASLTLRPPVGKDMFAAGEPFKTEIGEDGRVLMVTDTSALRRMMARLTTVPPESIDELSAADWNRVRAAILGFFGAAEPSTSISTSPASGASPSGSSG